MKQQAIPYLVFNGNAKEALEYYRSVFGGEITDMQTFGEAGHDGGSSEAADRLIHARFKCEALFFMVSDNYPGGKFTIGNNISLALELDSGEEIEKIYQRLSERGTVKMELQDTFWGARYGQVRDPYGIQWDLNYTKEN